MLFSTDQYLASQVSALLDTRLLVFDVNSARASIDKHLDQLHHRGYSPEASVGIGYTGYEIVDFLCAVSLSSCHVSPFVVLPSIVEELSTHELLHLVGDRVHGVVCEVWTRLVSVWHVCR